MYILWTALIALSLSGCATQITPEQIKEADYGEKPDRAIAEATIKTYLSQTLIDPNSLLLQCAETKKGWAREFTIRPPRFGWLIYCQVNAKNRMGGYTGAKTHIYLFNGNVALPVHTEGNAARGRDYDFTDTVTTLPTQPSQGARISLGVSFVDLPQSIAASFHRANLKAVMIVVVVPGSVAEKAGIKVGDVVFEFNGITVEKNTDMQKAVALMELGKKATVKLLRGENELTLEAQF